MPCSRRSGTRPSRGRCHRTAAARSAEPGRHPGAGLEQQLDHEPAQGRGVGKVGFWSERMAVRLGGAAEEPIRVQPGAGHQQPTLDGRATDPGVELAGGQQVSVRRRRQHGDGPALQQEAGVSGIAVQLAGQLDDVALAQSAVAQQPVGSVRHDVPHLFEIVDQRVRRPGRRSVDELRSTGPARDRRRLRGDRLLGEPAAPHVPGDFAGEDHGLGVEGLQQSASQQLLHRTPSGLRRHVAVGFGEGAGRRPGQPIQHRVDLPAALGHQGRHAIGRQRPDRRRSQRSGVRTELLADGADQMQSLIRTPEQSTLPEVVHRLPHGTGIGVQQFGEGFDRGGIGERRQPLGGLPLPGGEPVQGAGHRTGGGGLDGQVGQIVRDGLGQVRSQPEQGHDAVGLRVPKGLGQRTEAGPTSGLGHGRLPPVASCGCAATGCAGRGRPRRRRRPA